MTQQVMNLEELKENIDKVTDAAIKQLGSERKVNIGHIEEHIKDSIVKLDEYTTNEQEICKYIEDFKSMVLTATDALLNRVHTSFQALREREEERIQSLKDHTDYLKNDGSKLIENTNIKKIERR